MKRVAFIAIGVCAAAAVGSVAADGGLIGEIFKAAGRATGIAPLSELGENMDEEHKRFKDHNPFYKQVEEGASEFARNPNYLWCTSAFEQVIGGVRAVCSGFHSQSAYDPSLIGRATQRLVSTGVLSQDEFSGVSVSWCAGGFSGDGITPNSNEIILHTDAAAWPVDDVAALLAHEMFHVRQFRSVGSGPFKCNYAQQYVACGGRQDSCMPIERDAFQFQANAANVLAAHPDVNSPNSAASPEMTRMWADARSQYPFLSQPLTKPWSPPKPELLSDGLVFGPGSADPAHVAAKACTLDGRIPEAEVESCTDDLSIIYEDFLQTVEDDFSAGNKNSVQYYLDLTLADRRGACAILQTTHENPDTRRRRPRTCETISRGAIYRVLSYGLKKYFPR